MAMDGLFFPAIIWKKTAVTGYYMFSLFFFFLEEIFRKQSREFTFCLDRSLDMDLVINL